MLSDEEKKAIETIKDLKEIKWYEHAFDNGTEILSEEEKKDIDVILNLLEKERQADKEKIKELEAINKMQEYRINKMDIPIAYVEDNYIHKNEIRKEIEELGNMKVSGDVFITSVNFAIKILQELLKDGGK